MNNSIECFDLYSTVKKLIHKEEVIVIHSALSKLGIARNDAYFKALRKLLQDLIHDEKTVLLPSFNFTTPQKESFHIKEDLSETGVLATFAIEEARFHRTKNPMYSFAVKGPKQEEFLTLSDKTGYGKNSVVRRLDSQDVCVIMLGATWDACTIIHSIEEELNVPYREYKDWIFDVNYGEKSEKIEFNLYVRKKSIPTNLRFDRIKKLLIDHNHLKSVPINNVLLEAANGKEIARLAREAIMRDSYFFVDLI